jgi:hypothetical protein
MLSSPVAAELSESSGVGSGPAGGGVAGPAEDEGEEAEVEADIIGRWVYGLCVVRLEWNEASAAAPPDVVLAAAGTGRELVASYKWGRERQAPASLGLGQRRSGTTTDFRPAPRPFVDTGKSLAQDAGFQEWKDSAFFRFALGNYHERSSVHEATVEY